MSQSIGAGVSVISDGTMIIHTPTSVCVSKVCRFERRLMESVGASGPNELAGSVLRRTTRSPRIVVS